MPQVVSPTNPVTVCVFALLWASAEGVTGIRDGANNPAINRTPADRHAVIRLAISLPPVSRSLRVSILLEQGRFVILANSYADHDPAGSYKIDLLTGPRQPGEKRTMGES